MTGFKKYESFLYQIYKSIENIENNEPTKASCRIKNSYTNIKETQMYHSKDLRKYVESIIGSIDSGDYSRSKKLMEDLADEIEGYQRFVLNIEQHKNR